MRQFYTDYYAVIAHSSAHHMFCERVFGKDLGQHGFADLEQLELLLQVTQLSTQQHALDIGCGSGLITEYLADVTGAQITGLDYIEQAISAAQRRTATKSDRLTFMLGDINQLDLPQHAFDLILSIDTIYFSEDYPSTLAALKAALRPKGQLAIFYSYGPTPDVPRESFPAATLPADRTPLADALWAINLPYGWRASGDSATNQARPELYL